MKTKNAKPKWAKRLTVKELKHLAAGSETRRPTLRSLRANLAAQQANGFKCFECISIANKLGLTA